MSIKELDVKGTSRSKTYISPSPQHEDAEDDDEHIEREPPDASDTPPRHPPGSIVGLAHAKISHAPKDEAEEGVEQRTHQTQQVGEEGNDLGDDKGHDPGDGQDSRPRRPPDDRVVALVARALEDAEEHEAGRDGGVEDSEENEGGDHEGESDLLVEFVAEGSEGRSGVVLGAGVDVHDGADQAEDDDFGNGDGPERFGEIGGVAHFGDEAWNGDLADECVADVEERAESGNECGASGWDD